MRSVTPCAFEVSLPVTNCNLLPDSDFRNVSDLPEKYKTKTCYITSLATWLTSWWIALDVEKDRCYLAPRKPSKPGRRRQSARLLLRGRALEGTMQNDTMQRADVVAILRGLASKYRNERNAERAKESNLARKDQRAFDQCQGRSDATHRHAIEIDRLACEIEAEGKRAESFCESCGLQGGVHLPWCKA